MPTECPYGHRVKDYCLLIVPLYRVCVRVVAGHSWQEKVSDVRKKMEAQSATSLVVTAMDEIACE